MSLYQFLSGRLRFAADALDRASLDQKTKGGLDAVLDEYVATTPSHQNAVDVLPGWNHALPANVGAVAGAGAFYNDPRILWAIEQYGALEGRKILELGPLEASHTSLLERSGASAIHAIEANKLSFLRCLVVKEILDLKRVKFFLGDCELWLQTTADRYDLGIACGVLYHMQDPVRLLERMAENCDALYLWTHYSDDTAMPTGDPRRSAFTGTIEVQEWRGLSIRLHKRSYHGAWRDKAFCGGIHDIHSWMEREDILSVVRMLGLTDIRIAHDEPAHQNGPSFSVFARRAN